MTKHRYGTTEIKHVDWARVAEQVVGCAVVVAVDVAKDDFVAAVMVREEAAVVLIKWRHPEQTALLLRGLEQLRAQCELAVAMEPSGTYGDALRWQLTARGIDVYRASPKRVHDAAEVFDGVASLHDAKAALLIGRFHLQGCTQLWLEPDAERRELRAHLRLLELHKALYRAHLNRLEAQLSRHWPEALRILGLGSVSLAVLVRTYGSPAEVDAHAAHARALLRSTVRGGATSERIERLLDSAAATLGAPCVAAERQLLRTLAAEVLRARDAQHGVEQALKAIVQTHESMRRMAPVVGAIASATLYANHGDVRGYPQIRAYLKVIGLNLKERSSGKQHGPLRLSKRGAPSSRHSLYYAALGYLRRDEHVRRWYQAKLQRPGAVRTKLIVALMRRLAKALWHVARGARFDSARLFAPPAAASRS